MRGLVPGLPSPHPLGQRLPAVYQEDDPFTMRLTEAFDDALAPVISTLDNLPAYFDPSLTPEDFLGWLAGWVAFDLDETWDLSLRRAAVARAVDLLQRRGTVAGLADEVELITGGAVTVIENGGVAWSLDPASAMPGSPRPALLVRIRVPDPSAIDADKIDRIVRAAKPAHVPHKVEILPDGGGDKPKRKPPAPDGSPPKAAAGQPKPAAPPKPAKSANESKAPDAGDG